MNFFQQQAKKPKKSTQSSGSTNFMSSVFGSAVTPYFQSNKSRTYESPSSFKNNFRGSNQSEKVENSQDFMTHMIQQNQRSSYLSFGKDDQNNENWMNFGQNSSHNDFFQSSMQNQANSACLDSFFSDTPQYIFETDEMFQGGQSPIFGYNQYISSNSQWTEYPQNKQQIVQNNKQYNQSFVNENFTFMEPKFYSSNFRFGNNKKQSRIQQQLQQNKFIIQQVDSKFQYQNHTSSLGTHNQIKQKISQNILQNNNQIQINKQAYEKLKESIIQELSQINSDSSIDNQKKSQNVSQIYSLSPAQGIMNSNQIKHEQTNMIKRDNEIEINNQQENIKQNRRYQMSQKKTKFSDNKNKQHSPSKTRKSHLGSNNKNKSKDKLYEIPDKLNQKKDKEKSNNLTDTTKFNLNNTKLIESQVKQITSEQAKYGLKHFISQLNKSVKNTKKIQQQKKDSSQSSSNQSKSLQLSKFQQKKSIFNFQQKRQNLRRNFLQRTSKSKESIRSQINLHGKQNHKNQTKIQQITMDKNLEQKHDSGPKFSSCVLKNYKLNEEKHQRKLQQNKSFQSQFKNGDDLDDNLSYNFQSAQLDINYQQETKPFYSNSAQKKERQNILLNKNSKRSLNFNRKHEENKSFRTSGFFNNLYEIPEKQKIQNLTTGETKQNDNYLNLQKNQQQKRSFQFKNNSKPKALNFAQKFKAYKASRNTLKSNTLTKINQKQEHQNAQILKKHLQNQRSLSKFSKSSQQSQKSSGSIDSIKINTQGFFQRILFSKQKTNERESDSIKDSPAKSFTNNQNKIKSKRPFLNFQRTNRFLLNSKKREENHKNSSSSADNYQQISTKEKLEKPQSGESQALQEDRMKPFSSKILFSKKTPKFKASKKPFNNVEYLDDSQRSKQKLDVAKKLISEQRVRQNERKTHQTILKRQNNLMRQGLQDQDRIQTQKRRMISFSSSRSSSRTSQFLDMLQDIIDKTEQLKQKIYKNRRQQQLLTAKGEVFEKLVNQHFSQDRVKNLLNWRIL